MHRHAWIFAFLTLAVFARSGLAQDWPGTGASVAPVAPMGIVPPENLNRSVVPGPPMQPPVASRPSAWPGGAPVASPWTAPGQSAPTAEAIASGQVQTCRGTSIVARVGSEAILESELVIRSIDKNNNCEVVGSVDYFLEKNKDKIPAGQFEAQRAMLVQQLLKGIVQTKLIYLDAKQTIPAEGWSHVQEQLSKEFENNELERMMKAAKVDTRSEFDRNLRSVGSSIEREKRAFSERMLTRQWIAQQVKRDEEITPDQIVTYYRRNIGEFTTPPRALWDELTVSLSKYGGDKTAARDALARMGNQVLAGAPFAEVAKARSDGAEAAKGGRRDWTNQGSLVCKELDQALFGLPIDQLSPIIEGPTGYHIVRVVERRDTVTKSFEDAQGEIREKLLKQRTDKQFREYLAGIETKTPVWTIYDSDIRNPQLSRPPAKGWLR
jgi:hypothetical protein